jgi:hypothetical protein
MPDVTAQTRGKFLKNFPAWSMKPRALSVDGKSLPPATADRDIADLFQVVSNFLRRKEFCPS